MREFTIPKFSLKPRKHDPFDAEAQKTETLLGWFASGDAALGRKATRYKAAQVELQKRALADLKAAIPAWGPWGGPVIVFDLETLDIDQGQAMRFGVAERRGMDYVELCDFMHRERRPPSRDELDALKCVYIIFDRHDIEADKGLRLRSFRLLRASAAGREASTGVPHRLVSRDRFSAGVLGENHAIISKDVRAPKSPGDTIRATIPMPVMIVGHNVAFDFGRLPSLDARDANGGPAETVTIARGREMFGGFSLVMGGLKTRNALRVRTNKIGAGAKRLFDVVTPFGNRELETHRIVDTLQAAKAMLGAGTPASMDALCKMWRIVKRRASRLAPSSRSNVSPSAVASTGLTDERRAGVEHAPSVNAGRGRAPSRHAGPRSARSRSAPVEPVRAPSASPVEVRASVNAASGPQP
jgi:hypothetical protein